MHELLPVHWERILCQAVSLGSMCFSCIVSMTRHVPGVLVVPMMECNLSCEGEV